MTTVCYCRLLKGKRHKKYNFGGIDKEGNDTTVSNPAYYTSHESEKNNSL